MWALAACLVLILLHTSSASTTSSATLSTTKSSPYDLTSGPPPSPYDSTSAGPYVSSTAPQPSPHGPTPFDLWSHLPSEWRSFCDVRYGLDPEVNATLECNVTQDYDWQLQDLRDSLHGLIGLELAVDLQCKLEGRVSLPWPMRAPGLVKLTVVNCYLLDKYADFNTSAEQIPDSLRYLDMRDCTWLNYPDEVDYLIQHGDIVSSEYECGQDSSLRVYRYRAISDQDIQRPDPCNPVISQALRRLNHSLLFPEEAMDLPQWPDEQFEEFINDTRAMGEDYEICAERLASYRQMLLSGDFPEPMDDPTTTEDPREDARKSRIGLNNIRTTCVYQHLEVLDESLTVPLDRKQFEYLVDKTKYPKLRVLNYSYTNLGEVPKELREWRVYFDKSPLELIDLSHNTIQEVGNIPVYSNPFTPLNTTLDLQFNRIFKISFEMYEALSEQPDFLVDIRNNPIDCSCDMIGLKRLVGTLQDGAKWVEHPMQIYRQHLSVMTCATPKELFGRTIDSLRVEDLQCIVVESHVVVIVVLVVVVVALLVLLILALRYRREVRILLFTRVHIILPCGPRYSASHSPEKTFDAFVAYAHPDSDWVLNSLLKRLEEPSTARGCGPVKLCIHQRDFVVGKPIIDNIIDCIAASRHTIIVLSKNFARSSWAMEELRQAYRQSLEERRRHLLVVRLEEVPESDMDPVLRRCCKTFTYIETSDSFFWDRLIYSLHVAEGKKKRLRSPNVYDNANFSTIEDESPNSHEVQMEGLSSDINDNRGLDKTELFSENMKTVSAQSTCNSSPTAVAETYRRVNPDEVRVDLS